MSAEDTSGAADTTGAEDATGAPRPETPGGTAGPSKDGDLADLIKQVDEDPDADGASAMSDRLRDATPETSAEPESPADVVD